MKTKYEIIGVYNVMEDWKAIEMYFSVSPKQIDLSTFLLKVDNMDESDCQAAYNEHYLNNQGTEVIGYMGDQFMLPNSSTRVLFFMNYDSQHQVMSTQFGEIELPVSQDCPDRLSNIINFEFD